MCIDKTQHKEKPHAIMDTVKSQLLFIAVFYQYAHN